MKIINTCLFCALALVIAHKTAAQSETTGTGLTRLAWLLGTWEMQTGKGPLYEAWRVANDSTFEGRSYKISETQDTVVFETIQVTCRDKKFSYIPTVSDQNDQQPVPFAITTVNDGEFIAENPSHDFPRRIGYKRTGDRIEAWIDGELKGKYSKRTFSFVKKQ